MAGPGQIDAVCGMGAIIKTSLRCQPGFLPAYLVHVTMGQFQQQDLWPWMKATLAGRRS